MHNFVDFSFEDIFIYFLINDELYRSTVMPILADDYFDKNSIEQIVFKHVSKLFENESSPNDINFIQVWMSISAELEDANMLDELKEKFTLLEESTITIKNSFSQEDILEKTEQWAKTKALHNAVYESATILDSGIAKNINTLPDLFTNALNITLKEEEDKDIADGVVERYWMRKDNTNKIPFLVNQLNKITKNGLPRKSLSCFVLPTGGGKTAIFCSLAADYLRQKKNVLYVTLELSKELTETRIDANITNTTLDELDDIDMNEYIKRCEHGYKDKGSIIVKEFPTAAVTTSVIDQTIINLRKKKGFVPDVLILDYINLINPSRKVDPGSYTQVKCAAEEIRGICLKHNIVGITGTQVNRNGIKNNEIEMTDVSESMGLPFTLDFMIGGFATPEQVESNIIFMKPTKNRFSGFVNKKIMLELDFNYMRLRDLPMDKQKKLETNGSMSLTNNSSKTFRPMR